MEIFVERFANWTETEKRSKEELEGLKLPIGDEKSRNWD